LGEGVAFQVEEDLILRRRKNLHCRCFEAFRALPPHPNPLPRRRAVGGEGANRSDEELGREVMRRCCFKPSPPNLFGGEGWVRGLRFRLRRI